MSAGIYSLTNLVNGKRYIGQTTNLHHRAIEHGSELRRGKHHNHHLQSAYNKLGKDAFSFDVLCECAENELDEKERAWIDWYKTTDKKYGYNLETGGSALKHHSPETCAKLSSLLKGRPSPLKGKPMGEEHRRKIAEANRRRTYRRGFTLSEEHKRKIGEAHRGMKHSPESVRRTAEKNRGKPAWNRGVSPSDETRRKMSEAKKGKPSPHKGKTRPSLLGKKFSEERRRHISEGLFRFNASRRQLPIPPPDNNTAQPQYTDTERASLPIEES